MSWSDDDFKEIDLGDKRLNAIIIRLCDTLSELPESPINQACVD
ncbi:MAG: transposase [Spirochaetaceae bacterium]